MCAGRGPACHRRLSLCPAGTDALAAPAAGDTSRDGERRPPGGTATPSASVADVPFCHNCCARAVGFVSIAGASGFWFLVILSRWGHGRVLQTMPAFALELRKWISGSYKDICLTFSPVPQPLVRDAAI